MIYDIPSSVKAELESLREEIRVLRRRPVVGVAVIIERHRLGGREVLLGMRHASSRSGANTWGLPGGHLEHFEDIWDCAKREVLEETGIVLADSYMVGLPKFANVLYEKEDKHYLTLFVRASVPEDTVAELKEPTKCYGWDWFDPTILPHPLFAALSCFVEQGLL